MVDTIAVVRMGDEGGRLFRRDREGVDEVDQSCVPKQTRSET